MLWKETLEIRWKLVVGLMVSCTLALGGPALFWYMENNAEMRAQLQALPPELVGRMSDYQSLVYSNWFSQNLPEMGTILAVILGCSAIAGEMSKRTFEFLLSKPISRFHVLATKMAVGVVALGIVILLSSAVIYPASLILGYSISLTSLMLAGILGWCGMSVMFALSVFFSTFFDDVLRAAAVSLIVALALSIPGWFGSISRFSIYNHMQDYAGFQNGTIPLADVALLLAIFAVLVGASYLRFSAKEF